MQEVADLYSKTTRPLVNAPPHDLTESYATAGRSPLLDGTGERPPTRRTTAGSSPTFLEHLALSSLSPRTIRRHVDNLWLLGGEIIRDLHYDPSLRKVAAEQLLRKVIHEDGGPPSTPLAVNSTVSSLNTKLDSHPPTDSPDEPEIKLDGYRAIAIKTDSKLRLSYPTASFLVPSP